MRIFDSVLNDASSWTGYNQNNLDWIGIQNGWFVDVTWNSGFFARAMACFFSMEILVGAFGNMSNSFKKLLNQVGQQIPDVAQTCSAS